MSLRSRINHEQTPIIPRDITDFDDDTSSNETKLGLDAERRRRRILLGAVGVALTALLIGGGVTLYNGGEADATTTPEQLTAAEQFASRSEASATPETGDVIDYRALLAELGPAPTYEDIAEKASAPLAMSEIEAVQDITPAAVEVFDMWQSEGTQDMRVYYQFKEFQKTFITPTDANSPLDAAIEAFLASERIAEENARPYAEAAFHINLEEGYESSGMPNSVVDTMIGLNKHTIEQWIRANEEGKTYEASFVNPESSNPDGMSTGITANTVISWTRVSNAEELGLEDYEQTPDETVMGVWTSYQSHDGKDENGEFVMPRYPYLKPDAKGIMLIGTSWAQIEQTEQ